MAKPFNILIDDEDRTLWQGAANVTGYKELAPWIRMACNLEARRTAEGQGLDQPYHTVSTHLLSNLLLCSFRYALGRMTYVTSQCADWLTQWWHIMPRQWQEQIHNDIRQAIEHNCAGHDCDIEQWKRVLALPIKDAVA